MHNNGTKCLQHAVLSQQKRQLSIQAIFIPDLNICAYVYFASSLPAKDAILNNGAQKSMVFSPTKKFTKFQDIAMIVKNEFRGLNSSFIIKSYDFTRQCHSKLNNWGWGHIFIHLSSQTMQTIDFKRN